MQSELPPWLAEEPAPPAPPKGSRRNLNKLKAARKKVEVLNTLVRDDAFDEWVRRCLQPAELPSEWTQAATLYENYLKRAPDYGSNRGDKALAKLELATETRWGRMMGSVFSKKRRRSGFYYPVRLKQGA